MEKSRESGSILGSAGCMVLLAGSIKASEKSGSESCAREPWHDCLGGVLHSQPLRYRCWGSGKPRKVFVLYLLVLEVNFPCRDRLWEKDLPGFGRSVCLLCVRQDLEVQAVCSRNGVDQLLTVAWCTPCPRSLPFPLLSWQCLWSPS